MSSPLTPEDILTFSSHYSVRMHFMHLFWELGLFFGLFPFKGTAYGA